MRGLTLIETILYFALLTILMFAATALAASTSGAGARDKEAIRLEEELLFALRKIEWAHARSASVEVTPRRLRLRSGDGSIDPIVISVTDAAMTLSAHGSDAVPLFVLEEGDAARFIETATGFAFAFENAELSIERYFALP